MLHLAGQPVLDKQALIGGCVRLSVTMDAERLRAEVNALPASLWGRTAGRVGVHSAAEALFLRGFAPAEGRKPIEDRPPLQLLPYVRYFMDELIQAQPQRCLLARLAGGATIPLHVDDGPYFSTTVRIHVPVETHDRVWMACSEQFYIMRPGEIWALNNCAVHGVWNERTDAARTHLICDFLPSPKLLGLLDRGERDLGREVPAVQRYFDDLATTAMPPRESAARQ